MFVGHGHNAGGLQSAQLHPVNKRSGAVGHRQARGVGVGAPGVYVKAQDRKIRDSNKNASVQRMAALNSTVHKHAPARGVSLHLVQKAAATKVAEPAARFQSEANHASPTPHANIKKNNKTKNLKNSFFLFI